MADDKDADAFMLLSFLTVKQHLKGVQGRSRSPMLVPLESSSAVLVMMRSKSVSICNRSFARLDDSGRNSGFSREYPNLMHLYGGLLEPIGCQNFHR